jgi:hypothetical protein
MFRDSGRKRVILALALVAVLACAGLCIYSMLFVDEAHRASTYGVTNAGMAALVIKDETSDFYIVGIEIVDQEGSANPLGSVTIGGVGVFAIEPGKYDLRVEYSDYPDPDDVPPLSWYVHNAKTAEFSVLAKRAVIFRLEGGHESGMMYSAPDLISE